MTKDICLIPLERIEKTILFIRGEKVMLDSDLAELYGVNTSRLLEAVKRNSDRFPEDFMFQLTDTEFQALKRHSAISNMEKDQNKQRVTNLRSQIAISSSYGGRRYNPYVFTEQGIAMLSSVLNSPQAIKVNIEIMRVFVKLRKLILSNADLALKLEAIEKKYDAQFKIIYNTINEMIVVRVPSKKKIGFKVV